MDAPPPKEDCRPFVHVAALLRDAGAECAAHPRAGPRARLPAADRPRHDDLPGRAGRAQRARAVRDAIDALVRWQRATRAGVLPPYDEPLLRRELELFPDWYVGRHLGATLDRRRARRAHAGLRRADRRQPRAAAACSSTATIMPRNLMVADANPASSTSRTRCIGPITYDLVSLFQDAFVELGRGAGARLDDPLLGEGAARGAAGRRRLRRVLPARFEWMGVQRQLKVLGIFARICHRDGKSGYVEDMPRVIALRCARCARALSRARAACACCSTASSSVARRSAARADGDGTR